MTPERTPSTAAPKFQIWVVEDDPGCQFVMQEIFELRYGVQLFSELHSFVQALGEQPKLPDLVIADVRLPGQSLLQFLQSGDAQVFRQVPFVVVSSVDDIDALRLCFEKGAVDYLTKPFTKNELIVKVERILAKNKSGSASDKSFRLDLPGLRVVRGERVSETLTTKEFQIITILSDADLKPVTREEILSRVWGEVHVTPKTLDVHLHHLRKKLIQVGMEIRYVPPHSYALLCDRVDQ